eukprot:GHVP01021427.1.p1 GENE.GHVP01021427.1~~GHVP01021427.1.p1  ORF type:complete len:658 (+),score=133.07 GHVP01021427.1:43-2016(+)
MEELAETLQSITIDKGLEEITKKLVLNIEEEKRIGAVNRKRVFMNPKDILNEKLSVDDLIILVKDSDLYVLAVFPSTKVKSGTLQLPSDIINTAYKIYKTKKRSLNVIKDVSVYYPVLKTVEDANILKDTIYGVGFGYDKMSIDIISDDGISKLTISSPERNIFSIDETTNIQIKTGMKRKQVDKNIRISKEYLEIKDMIQPALKTGSCYTKGLILNGSEERLKKELIEEISMDMDLNVFYIYLFKDPVEKIRAAIDLAKSVSPSVLFFTRLGLYISVGDGIKDQVKIELEQIFDSISDDDRIFLIGTANELDILDESLVRVDRFEEIFIPAITDSETLCFLNKTLEENNIPTEYMDKRVLRCLKGHTKEDISLMVSEFLFQYKDDNRLDLLLDIAKRSSPTFIRDFKIDIPNTKWDDIAGNDNAKKLLIESIDLPINRPEALANFSVSSSRGTLLYGPPGCSKTMMARALASETGMNFLVVKGPELLCKYVGESEKRLREIFRRARKASPCILFFDEIDTFCSHRSKAGHSERLVSQLLVEIDGIKKSNNLFVLAATNRIDSIDRALLRPGRFDRHIEVKNPDRNTRRDLFYILARKMPFEKDLDLTYLLEKSEGMNGAEFTELLSEAAYYSMERDGKYISKDDLVLSIDNFYSRN